MNFSKQDKKDESKAEIKENVNEETKDENKDAVTEEVKEEVEPPSQEEPPSILRTIRNVIIGLVVLTILVIGGFAAAVKFNVLKAEDVAMLNEELGLYRLPLVGNGRYFEVPEGVEWPPPPEPEPEPEPKPESEPEPKSETEKPKPKNEEKPREVKIDRKTIEEQRAQREAEEKKRVTRLARIYESMKPEQAAKALVNVDWDTTVLILQRMSEDSVAQVLAKMEPEVAAQLTEMLYAGTQRRVTTPSDTMRNEPVTAAEQITGAE